MFHILKSRVIATAADRSRKDGDATRNAIPCYQASKQASKQAKLGKQAMQA